MYPSSPVASLGLLFALFPEEFELTIVTTDKQSHLELESIVCNVNNNSLIHQVPLVNSS